MKKQWSVITNRTELGIKSLLLMWLMGLVTISNVKRKFHDVKTFWSSKISANFNIPEDGVWRKR